MNIKQEIQQKWHLKVNYEAAFIGLDRPDGLENSQVLRVR